MLGQAKWYLGIKIKQSNNYITLDQEQYIKNIISGFEKSFKHKFKVKNTPLPNNFVPTKKDSPITETQNKEVKLRFGNLHYRSVIGYIKNTAHKKISNISQIIKNPLPLNPSRK